MKGCFWEVGYLIWTIWICRSHFAPFFSSLHYFRDGDYPLTPRERERLPPSHPARHMPPPEPRSPPPRMLPPDSRGSPPRMLPPDARSPPPYDRRGPPLPPGDNRSPPMRLPPPDMVPPMRGPLPPHMGPPPMGSPGPRMDSPRGKSLDSALIRYIDHHATLVGVGAVSYTHLTLPTRRTV